MKTLFTWTAIIGCCLFGYQLNGGQINGLFQPGTALMVFGPIVAFWLIRHGFEDFFGFFKRIFAGKPNARDVETMDRTVMMGFMLGAVACLFNMMHIMERGIGNGFSGGLFSVFLGIIYGITPAVCFWSVSPNAHGNKGHLRTAAYAAAAAFVMILSATLLGK
jgi:flagellar motor component MotA